MQRASRRLAATHDAARRRQLVLCLTVLVPLALLGAGCASTGVNLRSVPRTPLSDRLKLTTHSGPEPSERTGEDGPDCGRLAAKGNARTERPLHPPVPTGGLGAQVCRPGVGAGSAVAALGFIDAVRQFARRPPTPLRGHGTGAALGRTVSNGIIKSCDANHRQSFRILFSALPENGGAWAKSLPSPGTAVSYGRDRAQGTVAD